jgi:DnaJ-class molecular chaperone
VKTVSHPPVNGVCGNCHGTGATTVNSTGSPSSGVVHDQRICPICDGSGQMTFTQYVAYLDGEIGVEKTDRLIETLGRKRSR